jgi:ATP diphosphatase
VQNNPASHESPNYESHRAALEDELGDVLFSIVNVARYLKIDPERALRGANAKFERRFGYVEAQLLQRGTTPEQSTLEEMDELWEEGKREERGWQAGPLATGQK